MHSRRYEYLKSFLRQKYGTNKIRVLEIGVGHGRLFAELNSCCNIDYTGIEFLDVCYQAAKEKYESHSNFNIILGSILDSNLQSQLENSYDVVIALETFEHIHARDVSTALGFVRNKIISSYFISSVPVEIGLIILIKNLGSCLMHYSRGNEYSAKDTIYAMLNKSHKIKPHSENNEYPGHKGFDWRFYRYLLHQDFNITKTHHLPIPWLPALLSTNILFVSTPREILR